MPTSVVAVGADSSGNPIYPAMCDRTLSFPRFALSDGTHLYIADGGNDRVLVFNTIPTTNAPAADVILGQPDEYNDILVTSTNNTFDPNLFQSASNVTPSPTGLAWDGTSLYVTDSLNYRILVFTPGHGCSGQRSSERGQPGDFRAGQHHLQRQRSRPATLFWCSINDQLPSSEPTYYLYTVVTADTLNTITTNITNLINRYNNGAGDSNVLALAQLGFQAIQLVARNPGSAGNNITIASTTGTSVAKTSTTTNGVTTYTQAVSGTPTVTAAASSSTLSGGGNAATLAPGTLISIKGANLSDNTVSLNADQPTLFPELRRSAAPAGRRGGIHRRHPRADSGGFAHPDRRSGAFRADRYQQQQSLCSNPAQQRSRNRDDRCSCGSLAAGAGNLCLARSGAAPGRSRSIIPITPSP